MFIIMCIGAAIIGVVTSIFGYGCFNNGQFYANGCFLSLFLVTMFDFIVYICFKE